MADLVALIAKLDGIGEQPAAFDLYVIRQACREAAAVLQQRALVPLPEEPPTECFGGVQYEDSTVVDEQKAIETFYGKLRARYGQTANARIVEAAPTPSPAQAIDVLVAFFNTPEGFAAFGSQGDYDELRPEQTAIRAMKECIELRRKLGGNKSPTPSPARPKLLAYRLHGGGGALLWSDAQINVSPTWTLMGEVPLIERGES